MICLICAKIFCCVYLGPSIFFSTTSASTGSASVSGGRYLILYGLSDHLFYYIRPNDYVFLLGKLVTSCVVCQQSVDALQARRRTSYINCQVVVMTKDQVVSVFR